MNDEAAIAAGTRLISAAEAAPRLGFKGRKGIERLRALSAARIIPAVRMGRSYLYHWPTVTAALTRRAM